VGEVLGEEFVVVADKILSVVEVIGSVLVVVALEEIHTSCKS
jgi:hypothetical protein